MAEKLHGFSERGVRRIVESVRLVESSRFHRPTGRQGAAPRSHVLVLEGTLDADLDAPTDEDTPTTAALSVHRFATVGGVTADTADNITVHNRDAQFSAAGGDWIVVARMGEEWRPVGGIGGSGGQPIGPTQRVQVTGTTTPDVGTIMVLGDTDAAGGSMTIDLDGMAAADGDFIAVRNTGTIKANSVTVQTLHATESSSSTPALSNGASITAIYELSTDKWWQID